MGKIQVTKSFSSHCRLFKNKPPKTEDDDDDSQAGVNKASKGGIIYGDYLQVEKTTYYTYLSWLFNESTRICICF